LVSPFCGRALSSKPKALDKQLKDWEKITKSLTDNYILPSIKSHITENIDISEVPTSYPFKE
jgi:hypothetical protein